MSEYNDSSKTTGFQVLFAILGALIAPVLVIVLILKLFIGFQSTAAQDAKVTVAEVTKQVEPVAKVEVLAVLTGTHVDKSGEAVYGAVCTACHAAGMLGSPKFGDKAAWSPRIAQGYETLVSHAINGIRSMPARGGNAELTDGEMHNAVAYMTNAAGAKFTAPAAGAAPAATVVADAKSATATAPVATSTAAVASTTTAQPVKVADAAVVKVKAKSGEEVYKGVCSACHSVGLLGSPKFGDKTAWAPRIAQGQDTLVSHAINGIRSMPARGGNPALSDEEVGNAVAYMVSKASSGKTDKVAVEKPVSDKTVVTIASPTVNDNNVVANETVPSVTATSAATAPPPAAVEEEEEKPEPTNYAGPKVYALVCSACHAAGLAGAPKFGDAEAWAPRIAEGYETLISHAVNGIRAMPAKGGNPNLSDAEVARAVAHMANKAGANFTPPN